MTQYQEAIRLKPDYAEAHLNLGNALQRQGQLAEAVGQYQEAIRFKPDYAEAHNNLGAAFLDQGRLAEAVTQYQEAIRLKPHYVEAHYNLGLALQAKGHLVEAVAQYHKAIRLKPDYVEAHSDRALTWLLAGDFKQGWAEYEWRWQTKQLRCFKPSFPQPLWDGSSLSGKTILLWAEQGLGDTLQFVRYAALVKQQGGTVLLSCPDELARILQACAGIDHIFTPGSPLPPFDVQVPLLSLPGILKTTLATVPASIPYLFADAALEQRWQEELAHYAEFKIGIVWQGNPRSSQPECRVADQRRSAALAQFEPVARLPGVRLFSLQKGYGTEQLTERQAEWGIVDLGEKLSDFMDTAAVMMNLDLIISVDTAPLHLAGALGLPVWGCCGSRDAGAGCWTVKIVPGIRPCGYSGRSIGVTGTEVFKRITEAVFSFQRLAAPRSLRSGAA